MCKQTEEQLQSKLEIADQCLYIEIASTLVIMLFTFFARRWTKNLANSYDEKNVTPSDYTLFFRLEPEQNKVFDSMFYNPSKTDESRGQQMVDWL